MALAEVVKRLRKDKGWSQDVLASKSGVSRSVIAQVETGKNGFSPENARLVAHALEVNVDLLDFVKSNNNVSHAVQGVVDKPNWGLEGEGVPYYDVDVFAGDVETFNDGPQLPVGYLQIPGAEGCDFSCRISGNSMATRIMPGAIIACKEIRDKSLISYGAVHLVITDEQRWVKIVRKHQQKELVRLLSNNPDYDEIDCPIDKINRLYLVKIIVNQEEM